MQVSSSIAQILACQSDEDCDGLGLCDVDSGECHCLTDAHCSAEGVDTCALE